MCAVIFKYLKGRFDMVSDIWYQIFDDGTDIWINWFYLNFKCRIWRQNIDFVLIICSLKFVSVKPVALFWDIYPNIFCVTFPSGLKTDFSSVKLSINGWIEHLSVITLLSSQQWRSLIFWTNKNNCRLYFSIPL